MLKESRYREGCFTVPFSYQKSYVAFRFTEGTGDDEAMLAVKTAFAVLCAFL